VSPCIFQLFFKIFDETDAKPLLSKLSQELKYFDDELIKRNTNFFAGECICGLK
jgi:hypothetical protein